MSSFFDENILEKIKKHETGVNVVENFLTKNECDELLDYFRNLKNKSVGKSQSVEREESTKIFFDFEQSERLLNLKKRIEEKVGEFFVNDFQPHIITSRYPLRLHADTGKNPKDVIFKNIIIPLEIVYNENSKSKKPPNTIIFKNKWYNESALFTQNIGKDYDFIIKDKNGNFVDILDINDFYKNIVNLDNQETIYKNSSFHVDEKFKKYIESLTKSKRYNIRTNKHMVNDLNFNEEDYRKYMSHQPYEDCKSLEIDKVVEWKIGSLIYWDRSRIHSSDNFLINNVLNKTPLAMFTSKIKF
ncbi:MAG: hypothetical protein CNA95_00120 [Pelagibacterales bacterium MED-G41]|nr:MAG: hypothetical protein CNA95_00120 [Pelagibacterales bacterium MED-G41]